MAKRFHASWISDHLDQVARRAVAAGSNLRTRTIGWKAALPAHTLRFRLAERALEPVLADRERDHSRTVLAVDLGITHVHLHAALFADHRLRSRKGVQLPSTAAAMPQSRLHRL